MSHILPPQIFSSTNKAGQKIPVQNLSQLFTEVFVWKVWSGVVLVRSLSPSVRIHQLLRKVQLHIQIQVAYTYDKKIKRVMLHMLFTPSPLSQTVTPSRTPSSGTYFLDGSLFDYFLVSLIHLNVKLFCRDRRHFAYLSSTGLSLEIHKSRWGRCWITNLQTGGRYSWSCQYHGVHSVIVIYFHHYLRKEERLLRILFVLKKIV